MQGTSWAKWAEDAAGCVAIPNGIAQPAAAAGAAAAAAAAAANAATTAATR